jgi:hypothetical protein
MTRDTRVARLTHHHDHVWVPLTPAELLAALTLVEKAITAQGGKRGRAFAPLDLHSLKAKLELARPAPATATPAELDNLELFEKQLESARIMRDAGRKAGVL